jgi:RimJ/RimL family protein N-acetyltransferase
MATLTTSRLILRPWRKSDAASLYEMAKDPRVGPAAGWPVHTSKRNSRKVIRNIFSADETYAITIKGKDTAIGSIGLVVGAASNHDLPDNEAEIGYWIGVPFWGRGYVTEATRELIRHAFEDLGVETLWCSYFDGNDSSRRITEKCGFVYQRTEQREWPLLGKTMILHITRLTR